jgi:uncharacterized protein (TIRG00374 family)
MSSKFKSTFIKLSKVTIPLLLGVVILYFLYKETNGDELWANIQKANWVILSFSLLFGLSGNVIRGLRWKLIIEPLGYTPKKSNIIYAVLGNYAVNFALPRAGELWRCGVIAKEEKIPFVKLIGTLIVDRLFDTLMVILIFFIALASNFEVFINNFQKFDWPDFLTLPYFYVGFFLLLSITVALFITFKENVVVKKTTAFFVTIWQNMLLVRNMKAKMRFIFYTFGIWISYFFYFYVTLYAFDFTAHLGLAAGLFVFTIGSISMGIPSNGGLGPWQAAVVFGLYIFMIDKEEAKAFATVVFAFQSIWIVLCGLFGIAMLSIKKGNNLERKNQKKK